MMLCPNAGDVGAGVAFPPGVRAQDRSCDLF
jgi:hypothetical protein